MTKRRHPYPTSPLQFRSVPRWKASCVVLSFTELNLHSDKHPFEIASAHPHPHFHLSPLTSTSPKATPTSSPSMHTPTRTASQERPAPCGGVLHGSASRSTMYSGSHTLARVNSKTSPLGVLAWFDGATSEGEGEGEASE